MNIELYENNAGGLTLVAKKSDRYEIVTGIEHCENCMGNAVNDILSYGSDWDYIDVTDGYTADTLPDAIGVVVAEYDGDDLTIYPKRMGTTAREYFGITVEV